MISKLFAFTSRFRKTGLALVFAASALTFASAFMSAHAQSTVLVFDQQEVMGTSKAGKDMDAKLNAIADAMDKELGPEDTRLDTERKAIQQLTVNLTPEQINARADLKTRIEAFRRSAIAQEQKRAKRAQELQETQKKALAAFFTAQQPVLAEIVKEKNATIVLEISRVVWNSDSADITKDFVAKMDAKTPTISVTRVTLPDPPARASAPN
jgi:outer membrane protein